MLDSSGRFAHRFGGKGKGPGEPEDLDGNIRTRSVSPTSLGSSDSALRGEPAGPERWTVFASSGEWLGTVQMPDGLALAQVANGRVYGVYRDELGVATGARPPYREERERFLTVAGDCQGQLSAVRAHFSCPSSTRAGRSASRP